MSEKTEDVIVDVIGDLFYAGPALLVELEKKCRNPKHAIPEKIEKHLLNRGLIENGEVPDDIKKFVLKNIKIVENGISMSF